MSNSWEGRSLSPRWGHTVWTPLGGSVLYCVSILAFNSPWARSCFLYLPLPQPPITYKTARHWTVCFGPHCTLPGPTWGTFQALRNCDRKLGNKTEPLNHYLNNYRAGDFGVSDWVWIYRPYLHVKTTASYLTSRNLYCVISKMCDDTTHAQVVVKPENA